MKCFERACSCQNLTEHLARNSSRLDENAATESLAYMVNRSSGAARAMDAIIDYAGISAAADTGWIQTQVSGSAAKGLPDLTIYNRSGKPTLVSEVKFDAPLTPAQRQGYRGHLKPAGPNASMFIVPEHRIALLADQLTRELPRIKCDGSQYQTYALPEADTFLSIVSWDFILNTLNVIGGPEFTPAQQYDLEQLQSLVKVKTAEQFPLLLDEYLPTNPNWRQTPRRAPYLPGTGYKTRNYAKARRNQLSLFDAIPT